MSHHIDEPMDISHIVFLANLPAMAIRVGSIPVKNEKIKNPIKTALLISSHRFSFVLNLRKYCKPYYVCLTGSGQVVELCFLV